MNLRRNDLDYARALAMLLIVVGHTNGISAIVDKMIYSFHVPLFFVISRMLVRYSHTVSRSWKHIIKSRFWKTILPSVVWEIILSVFYYFIKGISVKELVINSLTLNFNLSVLWFIPCLIIAEFVWLGALKLWNRIAKKEEPILMCAVMILLFGALGIIPGIAFFKRIFVALAFLIFGYLIERLREKEKLNIIISHWGFLIATVTLWIVTGLLNSRVDLSAVSFGNPILYYLESVFGSISVILAFGFLNKFEIKPFLWYGKNTMGVLVTHVFVRHAVIAVEERIFGQYFGGWSLALLIVVIDIAVVLCIGSILPEIFGQKRKKKV